MRNQYIETLTKLTQGDQQVYALISDNGAIVYDNYEKLFPNNLINIGIAEANMISIAAGMAACGKIPFTYTIASFLTMRAFEQIRNDVCLQKMNVKLIGVGAGFSYSQLGPTHHALEDIALMRALPGMTIFSPATKNEVVVLTTAAKMITGPVYMRLSTIPVGTLPEYTIVPGQAAVISEGTDVAIVTTGIMVHEAYLLTQLLKKNNIAVQLIHIHTIKPLDEQAILLAASTCKVLITLEDHSLSGGLGEAVSSCIVQHLQQHAKVKCFGMNNFFGGAYGSFEYLKQQYKLDAGYLLGEVQRLFNGC